MYVIASLFCTVIQVLSNRSSSVYSPRNEWGLVYPCPFMLGPYFTTPLLGLYASPRVLLTEPKVLVLEIPRLFT